MGSHHPPRYCFSDVWYDSPSQTVTVRFTTGEYYAYYNVADTDASTYFYEEIPMSLQGVEFNAAVRPDNWSNQYAKVTGPPASFTFYSIGFNPAIPPFYTP